MGQVDRIVNSDDELRVARERLDNLPSATVLVVGSRTTNIQPEARNHPRVDVWESTEYDKGRIPSLPAATAVVIFTRFCSHRMTVGVRHQAEAQGAFVFGGLKQTGEIRSILGSLLDLHPVPASAIGAATMAEAPEPFLQSLAERFDTRLGVAVTAEELRAYSPTQEGGPMAQGIVRSIEERKGKPEPVDTMAQAKITSPATMESRIDDMSKLITESVAALTLVRDDLERVKGELKTRDEQYQTVRKLKDLLGNL